MNRKQKFFFALLISFLLHIFLLGLGAYLSILAPFSPEPDKKLNVIELDFVKDHPYQIADISPPEKEERPDDAKYLGLYDSKVAEEKVAANSGPSSHAPGQKISHKEVTEKAEKEEGKPAKKESVKEGYRLAAKPKEGSPRDSAPESEIGSDGEDLFEGVSGDFFPNYRVGDKTYLNVLKYPKIGYFVRMKKVFRTTFNPMPSIRQSILQISKGQIEVVLGVTVDATGKLADLLVIRSSGNTAYDQEALRTIRDSSPFAVPPTELLNAPGALRMAWTFTVYL